MLPIHAEFLRSVLPDTGVYVVVWKEQQSGDPTNPGKKEFKIKQKPLASIDAVGQWCDSHGKWLIDSWFAPATYQQGWHAVDTSTGTKNKLRTQNNVALVKSLWLDVDVGDGKDYRTRAEALQALSAFCKKLSLPCPWVLASGHTGVHVYWTFDMAVAKDEWMALGSKLRHACEQQGFKADPARTADPASILRAPGTWNCKDMNNPAYVQVLVRGAVSPVEVFARALEPYKATVRSGAPMYILPGEIPQVSIDRETVLEKYFSAAGVEYPQENPVTVMSNCRQINPRYMNEWNEPRFRGFLATLRHCDNGEYVAHKVASMSPHYTGPEFTRKKLDYLEENNVPPYLCETFAQMNPQGCAGCPFAGMVRSPIGTPRLTKKTPEMPEEETSGEPEAVEETPAPTIDTGNSRVNELGCFARVFDKEGNAKWEQVYGHPVYPVQRIRGRSENGDVVISYVLRKHHAKGYDDIQIPGEVLMGTGMNAYLGSVGFLLTDKEKKLMTGLLIDILRHAEHTMPEATVSSNMGWDADHSSFLLGDKLYREDGEVVSVSPRGNAAAVSALTVPKGTLAEWKHIANVYNKPGMEWAQATVLSAFASPIMSIGALEKAALLFLKGGKGVGKSTALMTAVSVYGHPTELMVNKDDTYLARIEKLGVLHNITAGFDEMTDLSPKEASELAYQITQGRGKDRMKSGGEGLQYNTTRWSCLPVMTANDSILSALAAHKADASAQMSRVLEVHVPDMDRCYTPQELVDNQRIMRRLPVQYGTAGDAYIRYVVTHQDDIEDMIAETEVMFRERSGLGNADRFWIYMCTRLIVALRLARELNILSYDPDVFVEYLLAKVEENRAVVSQLRVSVDTALAMFLNSTVGNRLVVKFARRPASMQDDPSKGAINDINYVVSTPAPGREVLVRVELSQNRVVIGLAAFKSWCSANGMVFTEVLTHLQNKGTVLKPKARHDLGGGTAYRGAGGVDCIVLNASAELISSSGAGTPDGDA